MPPLSRRSSGLIALVPCIFWLYALPASAQESPPQTGAPPTDASTPPAEGATPDQPSADDLAEIEGVEPQ